MLRMGHFLKKGAQLLFLLKANPNVRCLNTPISHLLRREGPTPRSLACMVEIPVPLSESPGTPEGMVFPPFLYSLTLFVVTLLLSINNSPVGHSSQLPSLRFSPVLITRRVPISFGHPSHQDFFVITVIPHPLPHPSPSPPSLLWSAGQWTGAQHPIINVVSTGRGHGKEPWIPLRGEKVRKASQGRAHERTMDI